MNKKTYRAWVQNDDGASMDAGMDTSLTRLKAYIRRNYGKGWTVHIMMIEHDGIDGWFAPVEVAKYKLRK